MGSPFSAPKLFVLQPAKQKHPNFKIPASYKPIGGEIPWEALGLSAKYAGGARVILAPETGRSKGGPLRLFPHLAGCSVNDLNENGPNVDAPAQNPQ